MKKCVTIRYINSKYKERKNTLSGTIHYSERILHKNLVAAGLTPYQAMIKINREAEMN